MQRTPIYVDLSWASSVSPSDPLEFTTTTADTLQDFLSELGASILVMAPRYYLRVKPPLITNEVGVLPVSTIPIQRRVNNTHYVSTSLVPTVGYGINCTYTVEYWSWTPIVKGALYTKTVKPSRQLLRVEHWLVPCHNQLFAFNYRDWLRYQEVPPVTVSSGASLPEQAIELVTAVNAQGNLITPLPAPTVSYLANLVTASISEKVITGRTVPGATTVTYKEPPPFTDVLFTDRSNTQPLYEPFLLYPVGYPIWPY